MGENKSSEHDRKRQSQLSDPNDEIFLAIVVAVVFGGGGAMMRWIFGMEFGFIAIYLGIAGAILGAGFWIYSQSRKSSQL